MQDQTEIKLCTDCVHYVYDPYLNRPHVCKLGIKDISLVTGSVSFETCSWMRHSEHRCGQQGKFFEAKPKKEGFLTWLKNVF